MNRDRIAVARDRAADSRDEDSERLDDRWRSVLSVLENTDGAPGQSGDGPIRTASRSILDILDWARRDRAAAAADRRAASADRQAAAADRHSAGADRMAAAGDRGAAEDDRDQPTAGSAEPAEAPEPPSVWDCLTATERRVARLVAQGLTNREVAQRLVVSQHTVDSHIKHVFTKLAIHSRVQLTRLVLMAAPVFETD